MKAVRHSCCLSEAVLQSEAAGSKDWLMAGTTDPVEQLPFLSQPACQASPNSRRAAAAVNRRCSCASCIWHGGVSRSRAECNPGSSSAILAITSLELVIQHVYGIVHRRRGVQQNGGNGCRARLSCAHGLCKDAREGWRNLASRPMDFRAAT